MEEEGVALLAASGVAPETISHLRQVDMRYVGQGHEILVTLPTGDQASALRSAFEKEYRRLYDRLGPEGVPVEAMAWRVRSTGPRPDLALRVEGSPGDPRKGSREAYVPESGGMREVPVFDRYRLSPGTALPGPAIVEERESTTIVGRDATFTVDSHWNLVIEFEARP